MALEAVVELSVVCWLALLQGCTGWPWQWWRVKVTPPPGREGGVVLGMEGDLTLILPFQLIYWVVYTPTV